eukprot:TRINITY_DN23706_c0_g1_i1.p1 TRINITY_DN23706_c0_g1~~TRINITY_DN23706_c0_g1_i1.p1  ORF type:complete len:651 (+),score=167.24 TRINITY_DN23706_c0_g1_i1:36-1988(+)
MTVALVEPAFSKAPPGRGVPELPPWKVNPQACAAVTNIAVVATAGDVEAVAAEALTLPVERPLPPWRRPQEQDGAVVPDGVAAPGQLLEAAAPPPPPPQDVDMEVDAAELEDDDEEEGEEEDEEYDPFSVAPEPHVATDEGQSAAAEQNGGAAASDGAVGAQPLATDGARAIPFKAPPPVPAKSAKPVPPWRRKLPSDGAPPPPVPPTPAGADLGAPLELPSDGAPPPPVPPTPAGADLGAPLEAGPLADVVEAVLLESQASFQKLAAVCSQRPKAAPDVECSVEGVASSKAAAGGVQRKASSAAVAGVVRPPSQRPQRPAPRRVAPPKPAKAAAGPLAKANGVPQPPKAGPKGEKVAKPAKLKPILPATAVAPLAKADNVDNEKSEKAAAKAKVTPVAKAEGSNAAKTDRAAAAAVARVNTGAQLAQEYFGHGAAAEKDPPPAKRPRTEPKVITFSAELLDKAPATVQSCRSLLLFLDKKLEAAVTPAPAVGGPEALRERLAAHADSEGRLAGLRATQGGWDARAKRVLDVVALVASDAGKAALNSIEKRLEAAASELRGELKKQGGSEDDFAAHLKERIAWSRDGIRREWLAWCAALLRARESALLLAGDGKAPAGKTPAKPKADEDALGSVAILESLATAAVRPPTK